MQNFFQRYNDLNKSKESGASHIEKLKEEVATLTKEKMAATSRESDSMREVRPCVTRLYRVNPYSHTMFRKVFTEIKRREAAEKELEQLKSSVGTHQVSRS